MLVFTVVSLLVLAFGQLAVLVSLMLGYAFPNAPLYFRIAMFVPLCVSTAMAFMLSWMALTGIDEVFVDTLFKLNVLNALLVFFIAKACVWWLFVSYVVYCRVLGRSCGM